MSIGGLREQLLHLLIAGADGPQAAAVEIARSYMWMDAVSLAKKWGVLPRLNQRLAALAVDVSDAVWPVLSSLTTTAFLRSAIQARKGIDVLSKLEAHGISAVAFKGLASMALLWEGPQHRTIQDVDVLVAERDVERALSLLSNLGFRPLVAGEFAEYAAFVRHSPGFSGNAEIALYDRERCAIDLHWRLGAGLAVEHIISRAHTRELLGAPVRVVAPEDGLVLCVHHILRNGFSPDKSLKDLLDAEAWCDLVTQRDKLDDALNLTAANGLSVPLLAITRVLAGFKTRSAAAIADSRLLQSLAAHERAAGERLGSLFLLQVRDGTLNPDLLYLLRPRDLKRILLGFLSGWRRHRELMQSAEVELEGAPKPLARRLWALLRSLALTRTRHLEMLRTLANAKDSLE